MAFNSFGQILRQGGEIALSIAKGLGFSESRIARLIEHRLRPDGPQTLSEIHQFTDDMIAAGRSANQLARDQQIPITDIPVNPYLFGDEPQGRRAFYTGEFTIEGIDKPYRVDVELADITTTGAIFEAMNAEAIRKIRQSPPAFGVTAEQAEAITNLFLIAGERRY